MKIPSLSLILLSVVAFGCGELDSLESEHPTHGTSAPDLSAKHSTSAVASVGTFALIASDECDNPCSFSVQSSMDIASVIYEADGWALGESYDASQGFALAYTFNTLGVREIRAVALGYGNERLAESTQFVRVQDEWQPAPAVPEARPERRPSPEARPRPGSRPNVPYFMQYDNQLHPGSSCQNTSIAMVLAYLGWSGRPDDITARFGKRRAQSPAGLASVFNQYASENGLSKRLDPVTNGSLSGLRAELDRGNPVIIHGFFTTFGHVLVVLGYDQNGYYVNDPAGRWSEVFKGGYGWSNTGRDLYYGRAAFEAAVGTSDGWSPLALWYHVLR